ncbi:M4 family metallopeptidase [Streptacidiphilus melanogenes]|uniref:M4 family metallopeptidase n=1 Tax=Streptacidiphilus melanogenes TaxID=411235 RepID=UPI00069463A9|nr:M4 family metallopeptidase [Streptacidiphilus melanogenes]
MSKSRRRTTAAAIAAAALIGGLAAAPAAKAVPPPSPDARALAAASAQALVAGRPAFLQAGADDQFVQHAVISSSGTQYVPYDRTYAGVPVVGGDFVVVTNSAGQVLAHSVAQQHPIGRLSITPTLSSSKAASVASARLRSVAKVEGTRLVVYALGAGPAALAWETTVDGTGPDGYSRLSVDVDAHTGAVLHTQEHVMHGSATGAWNGPEPLTIGTTGSGSSYSMNSPGITNMPCQDAATNTTFTKSTDSWGNGDATSKETGCVDALYGAQGEFRMLSQWLGRNGMDGNGGAWPIRVGLQDVNAYYDGTEVEVGHNSAGQWIGAIDVIAHEMGHGIDDHTPGGISGNGTQEWIGDVYGASTEAFLNEPAPYAVPDFLVGNQVNLEGTGPIRNMYNPSLINSDPNCYSSSIPGDEVHTAAGPGNHWFYLLSQGSNPTGGPTSPTCNGSTVSGIGIQNALKIVYNAQLMKNSSSSYLTYRTWTLQAAKNLDPSCAEFNTVKAAWNAVSVPAQSGDPTCTTGTNDFSLAVSPTSGTVTPGATVKATVATTLTSGSAQSVALSASGLPAGATATFSPASVTAGGTSQLSVSTASSTPTGTFNVTVTGTGSSATHTASFSLTVSSTGGGGGCTGGQLLGNPGFETGSASPWTASSGVVDNSSGEPAHSGSWKAWLDGYGTTHTDTLSQQVTIPAGCSATLTFYLHVDTAETTTTTAYDKLTVQAESTTLATYSNLNKATGYQLRSLDLSAYAGQTVTLKFTGTEDSSLQTSFVIDDTALNAS